MANRTSKPLPRLTDEQRQLVEDNHRLAWWFVKLPIVSAYVRLFASEEDAAQAAYLGMCIAASRFDPAKGKFTTYAYQWMRSAVQHQAYEQPGIPNSKHRFAEIGVMTLTNQFPELVHEEYEEVMIACHRTPEVEQEVAANEKRERIEAVMQKLPARHREVIRQRLMWGKTLSQVAESMGVTPERVRQMEADAKVKIWAGLRKELD